LRTRSVETRLAVKLATHPDAELEPHVCDIHFAERIGKPTARTSSPRIGEKKHDVEIVDHQVEH